MDFKSQFTYEGTIERDGKTLDKITNKVLSVTFALDKSPLPFSLKSSDLKAAESDGVILFDRERGQLGRVDFEHSGHRRHRVRGQQHGPAGEARSENGTSDDGQAEKCLN